MRWLLPLAVVIACRREPAHVLFVCEHGAAKSVIAAAQLERLAAERGLAVRAIARGADPQPAPSTRTLDGLARDGFAPLAATPRPFTASDVRGAVDIVIFDCDADAMRPLRALGRCWDAVPPMRAGYDAVRDAVRRHDAAYVGELDQRARGPSRPL
jgi:protein-tyrosine-phosphatase